MPGCLQISDQQTLWKRMTLKTLWKKLFCVSYLLGMTGMYTRHCHVKTVRNLKYFQDRFYFLVRCTLQIWIHTISGAKINIFFYSFSWRVHLYSEQKKNQGKMSFRLYRNLKLIYLQKLQPCRWYNNKYMIASTQTTSIEVFVFITVLVFFFKLLSRKVLFRNRKDNRNY